MSTLLVTQGFGLERIAREAFILLYQNLNDQLLIEQSAWTTLDTELASVRSLAYQPIDLEPIEPENFHLGHKPSLLEAPVDKYPAVAVSCYRVRKGQEDLDQLDIYRNNMFIETFCRATEDEENEELEAEELVNRRILRTTEAINHVILSYRTLNGLVQEIPDPPEANISDCFIRKERAGTGKQWFWQGARIEYEIEKPSTNS